MLLKDPATAIADKPILFSTRLVQEVMAGRKTQTRRVVRNQPPWPLFELKTHNGEATNLWGQKPGIDWGGHDEPIWKCPYGIAGCNLWVRETWRPRSWSDDFDWMMIEFRAGGTVKEINPWNVWGESRAEEVWESLTDEVEQSGAKLDEFGYWRWPEGVDPINWRPSIFMPKPASRITLEIKNIWFEKIQDISEEDAISEGISPEIEDPVEEFKRLWDSINLKRGFGWDANPWVWVVDFEIR